jgi:hypothetical protein
MHASPKHPSSRPSIRPDPWKIYWLPPLFPYDAGFVSLSERFGSHKMGNPPENNPKNHIFRNTDPRSKGCALPQLYRIVPIPRLHLHRKRPTWAMRSTFKALLSAMADVKGTPRIRDSLEEVNEGVTKLTDQTASSLLEPPRCRQTFPGT